MKCLLSPHNLLAVYSSIKGTTVSFKRKADNEINGYLNDAGDLNHLVYQLIFRQGLLNYFDNPRLDSEQSQKCMIYPWNIEIILESKSWLAQILIWKRPRYIWVVSMYEKTNLAYCFTFCSLIFLCLMKVQKPKLN